MKWQAASYPVVLKPTRSVVETGGGSMKTSVFYARNAEELSRATAAIGPDAFPVLVQRKVVGPGVGVFLLTQGGAVVASFGHRRIREKPPSGGVSVLSESAAPPKALLESSADLLQALGWDGLAMVEYKQDEKTGQYVLMEINGRLWGSLQLAIDSGVDFPALLVSLALGEQPAPQGPYRLGARTRWTLGDLDHLIARVTKSREALRLPPSSPGPAGAVGAFLRGFFPPIRSEILRRDDVGPAWRELQVWVRSSLHSRNR